MGKGWHGVVLGLGLALVAVGFLGAAVARTLDGRIQGAMGVVVGLLVVIVAVLLNMNRKPATPDAPKPQAAKPTRPRVDAESVEALERLGGK